MLAHERIVDCIARGDAEGAVQLMDQHLRELEQHLLISPQSSEQSLARLLGMA